jgi:hypothetical protein
MLIANLVMLLSLFGALNNARVSTGDAVEYRLLATNKTSTMEKEMNQASAEGFRFGGAMGGETAGGGAEMLVIMSRKPDADGPRYDYKLLATNKTSTMQKEMSEAGRAGFVFCGMTVAETSFGGREVVSIMRRQVVKELR